jgi:hypothetical protein
MLNALPTVARSMVVAVLISDGAEGPDELLLPQPLIINAAAATEIPTKLTYFIRHPLCV